MNFLAINQSIARRLGVAIGTLLIGAFAALFFILANGLESRLERSAIASLEATDKAVVDLVSAYRSSIVRAAETLQSVWVSRFDKDWQVDNGNLLNGGVRLLDGNERADRFTAVTGATATVFIRDGNDFRRIATSVKREDGSRAVGTTLGDKHPAFGTLMAGKRYVGVARLFGRDYMTVYEPLKNAGNQIVGVLYIGFDFSESLADLKTRLASIKIGETGYVAVIDAGKNRGLALVHPTLKDKNLLEAASGKGIVEEMLAAGHGSRRGDISDGKREFAFSTEPDFNWLIVSSMAYDEVVADARWARNLTLVSCLVTVILLLAALTTLLKRWVKQPLATALQAVDKLCQGDFTGTIEAQRDDEVGTILKGLTRMQVQIRQMLLAVQQTAAQLIDSSRQIDQSSQQVSKAVVEQSRATETVAAAVEELTVSITQVAENATNAHDTSTESNRISSEGGVIIDAAVSGIQTTAHMVKQTSTRVAELGDHADQISNVIKVIKEIADQTNLLALNAAIEAARAGETGRGFAVVADEVRKLAERTGSSTQEIAATIAKIQEGTRNAVEGMHQSVAQVELGVERANAAGEVISQISAGAGRVVEAVDNIKQTLQEQSSVANEVAQNVEQIARMSEANSQAVAESAAVAQRLQQMAGELDASIRRFRLQ